MNNFIDKIVLDRERFKVEFISLLSLSWPIIITNLLRFMNPIISVIVCGHLTITEFAAVNLACSIINIFGLMVDLGFSTAFDTFFAQIYGSSNKKKMGNILQRALMIMSLVYLLLVSFHINVGPFLVAIQQEPIVIELTKIYITYYLPGLYFDFLFLTMGRYLQNQNIVLPSTLSVLASVVFNAVAQTVSIHVYGYRIQASAVCQAVGAFIMFLCQLLYILISKCYVKTWMGWSIIGLFNNWGILCLLGVSGLVMVWCLEISYEVGTVVAGILGQVYLGAQGIMLQCGTLIYSVQLGVEIGLTIRIGQWLGANDVRGVKTAIRAGIIVGGILALFLAIFFVSLRYYIARLFSSNLEVQALSESLMYFLVGLPFIDLYTGTGASIMKATGRQRIGAIIVFVMFYLWGLPIGFILTYLAHIHMYGFWVGVYIAMISIGSIYLIVIVKIDWDEEFEKANNNTKASVVLTNYSGSEREILLPEDEKEEKNEHFLKADSIVTRKSWTTGQSRTSGLVQYDPSYDNVKDIQIYNDNDTQKSLSKRTIIYRIVFIVIVLVIFIGSICLRIFLPTHVYLPCIPRNNVSVDLYHMSNLILCVPPKI